MIEELRSVGRPGVSIIAALIAVSVMNMAPRAAGANPALARLIAMVATSYLSFGQVPEWKGVEIKYARRTK